MSEQGPPQEPPQPPENETLVDKRNRLANEIRNLGTAMGHIESGINDALPKEFKPNFPGFVTGEQKLGAMMGIAFAMRAMERHRGKPLDEQTMSTLFDEMETDWDNTFEPDVSPKDPPSTETT